MRITDERRGFRDVYGDTPTGAEARIVGESSAIREYPDAFDNPGSSCLWVGVNHLDREEVSRLVGMLNHWLENKRLPSPPSVEG